ncbi:MAG: hypothetical protein UY36_C0009G0005 [Parcubacteria group bacterium GW2011_GWA1_49_11]|uniref:DUF5673 domain-containing protein n=1 Tax=Candidatus Yanofskybacteria bacterium RIFCSPHIGHO2_01_FULL_48_25b TaxID=1802672 RepID=A0A1F8F4K0_9BACT|nr:MAG: hypothetical protein UY36_C0009G0005 [Parcubacteria group bacterium GW2011_GWA1_49_11]OGN07189.1 MAG: hypothetical protein A2669_00410 [Candidatus Yanofskybacteria bacterium RIFCSPHIGHO2_01_FULL_48_25b]
MSEIINLREKASQPGDVQLASGGTTASWLTHLAPPPDRRRAFYLSATLIIAAVLIAVFTKDIMLTIVLVMFCFVIILKAHQSYEPYHIKVHATGISINDDHHHYADMKSFWIEYEPYVKELSIEFKRGHLPRISIPLGDTNPLEIRRTMISYLPEKEHERSILDHLARIIGI